MYAGRRISWYPKSSRWPAGSDGLKSKLYKTDAQACQIYRGKHVTCMYVTNDVTNDVMLALSIIFSQ